ncbi:MAG: AI-2E family transporter [Chloroflexota bacterium]|nr:AI-2E family transporter [Chloroflexota bacterium]
MIDRLLSFLGRLPGALWRGTVGRLTAKPPPTTPVLVAEAEEPRSVAGITFRASLVVVGVVLAAYLLYQLRLLLILVFLAVLLAAGLYGLVRFFERFLPRILAVLLSYLLLIGVFVLVLFLIFPPLVRGIVDFADDLPNIADSLRAGTIELIDGIAGTGTGEEIVDTLTDGAQGALPEMGSLLSVPLTLASILTNTLVVIFLSALMLIERDRARGWVLEFVDERDRDALVGVSRNALLRLGAYVRGQLMVMAIIGIGSGIGMWVLGVPFAVPLGALSFITAAIPLAGAFIAGGPIVLVALTVSPGTALLMAAWLVVLQQLEGSVITPYIQGRIVSLSAIAVLLGVLAGTSIAGIVGGIIAIPLVAVADVVLRDIVFPLRRRAEDRRRGNLPVTEAPAL